MGTDALWSVPHLCSGHEDRAQSSIARRFQIAFGTESRVPDAGLPVLCLELLGVRTGLKQVACAPMVCESSARRIVCGFRERQKPIGGVIDPC